MKSFQLYRSEHLILILFFLILTTVSCKRGDSELLSTNGKSILVFSVAGLTNKVAKVNKFGSAILPGSSIGQKGQQATVKVSDRINLTYSAQEEEILTSFAEQNVLEKGKRKLASTSLLHDYTRYRVLLYNVATNLLVKSVETSAGGVAEIEVTAGDTYRWVAYSYNSFEPVGEPDYVNNSPVIRTHPDKEFIWASSDLDITATSVRHSFSIIFEHKTAEVAIELDTEDLYGDITDLKMEFDDLEYFNTAEINLLTGTSSDIVSYASPVLNRASFSHDHSADSTKLRAVLYTAKPDDNIEDLRVHIKKMTLRHINGDVNELHKESDPIRTIAFSFASPTVSKSHVAGMKLRYNISQKRILHVIGDEVINDDQRWGFAAQPRDKNATGPTYDSSNEYLTFNMIKQPLNFGNLSNSIVHTDGFTHVRSMQNQLAAKLTAPGLVPDIVIISVYYYLNPDDITALTTYLNSGGVVIMMTDSAVPLNAGGSRNEVTSVQSFFREFFENEAIELDYGTPVSRYYGPLMFKLDHERSINDKIINGPFGDLTEKFWGNDSYAVVQAKNLPIGTGINQVTVYSNPQAANSILAPLGISMFKHNSKDLFWIGDGSFLSHPQYLVFGWNSGWSNGWDAEPFATVNINPTSPVLDRVNPYPGPNHIHYPVPKKYGVDLHSLSVGFTYNSEVYNAPLFANLMAWALNRSEFYGINRGVKIPAQIVDWNVNESSFDINYNQ